jgi:nitric oxide reductase large subunit
MTPEGEQEMLRRLARIDRHLRALEIIAASAAAAAIYVLVKQLTAGSWLADWGGVVAVVAIVAFALYVDRQVDRDT